MNRIESTDNKLVKLAVSLKNKKYRYEERLFLAEGFRLLEELAYAKIAKITCFVNDLGQAAERFGQLYNQGRELGWSFFTVTDSVYAKIKETQSSQGIIGIVPFCDTLLGQLGQRGNQPFIYLDGIQDPGNLGTIIRTAGATACSGILLSEDCVDLYNGKTIRSTMGGLFKVPIVQQVTAAQLQLFVKNQQLRLIGTGLTNARVYTEVSFQEPLVIAFGNEGNGLSAAVLERCEECVTIPMSTGTESLNLSVAVGVVLYKAWEINEFKE